MADVTINVSVTGERLTLTNQPVLASGTVKAVQIQFAFDEVWDGYSKIALFWDESGEVYAWQVVNDLATVPHEVVASAGRLRFGVYGVKGTYRIVTEKILYDIADGAYTSVYDESTEPTPGIIDQIEAILATQGRSIQTLQSQMAATREDVSGLDNGMNDLRTIALGAYPTDSVVGAVAVFQDGADGVPVKALTVDIASQTGVTGLTLTRTGKNLWPDTYDPVPVRAPYYKPVFVGDNTVTLSTTMPKNTSNSTNLFLLAGIQTGGAVSGTNGVSANTPRTVTAIDGYVTVCYRNADGVDPRDYNTQLEIGDAATDFEAYQAPDEYTVAFPSEAGSVTNGTLDIINGVLTTGGQDYDVTPVDVRTLLGMNTIYASGGSVNMIYRADPTLFASKGQTEDDMTADAPIASGKYFQIGATLYRATAAIATGETIAPGTNCAVTSLAEALNLLNT